MNPICLIFYNNNKFQFSNCKTEKLFLLKDFLKNLLRFQLKILETENFSLYCQALWNNFLKNILKLPNRLTPNLFNTFNKILSLMSFKTTNFINWSISSNTYHKLWRYKTFMLTAVKNQEKFNSISEFLLKLYFNKLKRWDWKLVSWWKLMKEFWVCWEPKSWVS